MIEILKTARSCEIRGIGGGAAMDQDKLELNSLSLGSVIKVQGFTVTAGNRTLLADISLEVGRGEVFGIVGPSGSGKTTLLRSLAGTGMPGNGRIEVLGHRMPNPRVSGRLGYMAQADALYEDLTGRENLRFFAGLYGLRGKVLRSRYQAAVRLVELQNDTNKLVRKYSGGMKRRLSLAIALVHNPRLLLLDEPTVGVDPVLRQSFWQEFSTRKEAGTTLVITTHVMDEAMRCDRLAFIRDGCIIALGTPAELLHEADSQDLERAFVHYARMAQETPSGSFGRRTKRERVKQDGEPSPSNDSDLSVRKKQHRKRRER